MFLPITIARSAIVIVGSALETDAACCQRQIAIVKISQAVFMSLLILVFLRSGYVCDDRFGLFHVTNPGGGIGPYVCSSTVLSEATYSGLWQNPSSGPLVTVAVATHEL
jgi:hypothetical protein